LTADRQHHSSKKNRYTIVLVPDEDVSKSKNFRLIPWQLFSGLVILAVLAVALILITLTYTPLGQLFPLSNRGLENKYGRELISINQRMTGLMEQLVELRTYNIKLRRALGENIVPADSGIVKVTQRSSESENSNAGSEGIKVSPTAQMSDMEPQVLTAQTAKSEPDVHIPISFPAIIPTEGYMTRGFEVEQNHLGLDIAGKTGNLIVAAADGNVVFAGWTYNDGYVVIVSHSSGFMSFYKHNQSLLKMAGTFVRRGEPIATLGSSGTTSSGPHLHFEIWKDGVPVDPSAYLINLYL
jgi:murein DD-endopeptidase MepM/ murein hydrolase activator NlpD